MTQRINYSQSGARAQRVLEAITPLTGTTAPAVNAKFIGQIYVDSTAKTVYVSVAVGSETPAADWETADASAVLAAMTEDIEALTPLTGTAAPTAHANYVGQMFVDTTAKKIYISVATDSATAANDWKEVTLTA